MVSKSIENEEQKSEPNGSLFYVWTRQSQS